MRRRTIASTGAGLLLAALAAGPVAAGGWAEAKADAGIGGGDDSGGGITEGVGQEIGFTLLQHGVTPVDFGTATLVATNQSTGQVVRAPARSTGGGHWTATLTFPAAGSWQLSVEHDELLVSNLPIVEVEGAQASATVAQPAIIGLLAAMLVAVALIVISGRRLRRRGAEAPDVEVEAKLARA